jgi:DNA-binding transcriptional LysR family regulator
VNRNVELRHLRYFVAVAEEMHFGRAAERLHISQPPLSHQIQQLEDELGVKLFERSHRQVSLTSAGEAFLGEARKVLATMDQALGSVDQLLRGERGILRAAPPDVQPAIGVYHAAVAALARSRPGLTVETTPVPRTRQAIAVLKRDIDVGFGRAVDPSDYEEGIASEKLFDDPLRFALVSVTSPLARKERLAAADLRDVPMFLITREEGRGLHDRILAACRAIGLEPHVEPRPSTFGTVLPLVAAGAGWVPGSNAMVAQLMPGVAALPLEGFHVPSGFDVIWWKARPHRAVPELVNAIREAARALPGPGHCAIHAPRPAGRPDSR